MQLLDAQRADKVDISIFVGASSSSRGYSSPSIRMSYEVDALQSPNAACSYATQRCVKLVAGKAQHDRLVLCLCRTGILAVPA